MKKIITLSIVVVLTLAMLVGCGAPAETASQSPSAAAEESPSAAPEESPSAAPEESPSAPAEGTTYKIGFSNCSQDTPFFANMTPIIEDYAGAMGHEVIAISADNDVVKQNQDIQDLISAGIQILLINPVNEEGPVAGIEACNKAGIPVITVDKDVSEGSTVWVGRDNVTMGRMVGEYLIELLGGADAATGTILEIQGTAGSTTMMARRDGFNEAIAAAPGLTVVQSSYCDFDRSKAIPATQDMIQANDNIVAIFGHNDDMALGAAQVCQESGLDDVLVTGVDGLMEAVLAIETGGYAVTTSNDPVLLAQTAVDVGLKVLAGETLDSFVDAGTVVINKDNVAEYADASLDFATMVGKDL